MRPALAPLLIALSACDGCGACGGSLQVEGPHPYVRCSAIERDDDEWQVGGLSFDREGGVLSVEGLEPARVVAFALSPGADLGALPAAPLRVVLGGFARDGNSAQRLLGGLAAAGPTLLLPGGEDDTEVLDEALDAVDDRALVDLRGVTLVRLGGHEWVVVPGAPGGRYGRGERACGFAPGDLEALDPGDVEGPRHLLAWAAPEGVADQGFDGVSAGSPAVAALAERVQAAGGLFAWPRAPGGRVAGGDGEGGVALSVPVWGRITEGPDGSWSDGEALIVDLSGGRLRPVR